MLHRRIDELLRRNVHAEVDHVNPVPLKHDTHNVLTNIVQIALHRADHRRTLGLHARLRELRTQHVKPAFSARAAIRTSGTNTSLFLNFSPDDAHAGEQSLVEDHAGGSPSSSACSTS